MQLNMYICTAEKNAVSKNLESGVTYEGTVLSETSIIKPSFLIQAEYISPYNYLFAPNFGRYYYIEDTVSVRTNLWRVSCNVDVLMSFRDYIYRLECIISKQFNDFKANSYLNDGSFIADSRVSAEVVKFPGQLSQGTPTIVTLGPGGKIS